MADWTTIPDSSLEPGKPIRSIDGLALRDNPVAIAEGAAGAPRVAAAALQTGTPERDWVLARNATAAAGAVGTYVFAYSSAGGTVSFGGTRAGSQLAPVSAAFAAAALSTDWSFSLAGGSALSGTWQCMGLFVSSSSSANGTWYGATLWLRIA